MAVPFRRTSKTKKRMRRTHLKKEVGALTKCEKCGATLRPVSYTHLTLPIKTS